MTAASVELGPLVEEDSKTLFEWINDRELVLFNAPFHPVDSVSHREWFDSIRHRRDVSIFAIRDAGRLVGTCQLHAIDPIHRSAELQIRIGVEGDRGRGIGTEAVRHLLRHGFHDLNLNRVFLYVFAHNQRAIRAYEKAGFEREGLLRQAAHIDGRYADIVVMGVVRDEFA
jgi:RimJ/RimL family protein N-acetyltransferase